MKKHEALTLVSKHYNELHELGLKSVSLFGSVARDEATESSDIDLLVEFSRPVGLFHFLQVRRRLAEILGCDVDMVTKDALRDDMRDTILSEAIDAA